MRWFIVFATLIWVHFCSAQSPTYVLRHGKKVYLTAKTNAPNPMDDLWMAPGYHIPMYDTPEFGVVGTTIKGRFDADQALFKLFPGKHYYFSEDDGGKHEFAVTAWRMPQKRRRFIKDVGLDYWFPGERGTFTLVYKVVSFKDDSGRQFKYVVFEHNDLCTLDAALYAGVAFGANASIALFAKEDDNWVLTSFLLSAGSTGSYHQLTADLKVIKLGQNNYGLELYSPVNGPGGPSFGQTHLFAPVGNTIRLVYGNPLSAGYDFNARCGDWYTFLEPRTGSNMFNDLDVVVRGNYCLPSMAGGIFEDDSVGAAPDEVFFKTAVADSFGYKITRQYRYDGNEYKWQRTYYKTYAVKPKLKK